MNDWKPASPTDASRIHIYSPDPEDALMFHYEFTGMIKFEQVICKLEQNEPVKFLDEEFHMEISSDLYHFCVVEISKNPEKQKESELRAQTSSGQFHATSRGRLLRLPHRFRE